jgi:hypothetical protein
MAAEHARSQRRRGGLGRVSRDGRRSISPCFLSRIFGDWTNILSGARGLATFLIACQDGDVASVMATIVTVARSASIVDTLRVIQRQKGVPYEEG